MAASFDPVEGVTHDELNEVAFYSSIHDETPEGRSIVDLAKKLAIAELVPKVAHSEGIEYKGETRMSGTSFEDGREIRKGTVDAMKQYIVQLGGEIPSNLDELTKNIAMKGGTPLAVTDGKRVLGVINLKDTVKAGMKERFDELRKMGIKTVMCTGDNPLTAVTIAREAGVDDFISEAKPEDKIAVIRKEQAEGKLVAMTGDGTNDAPAIA